MRVLFHNWEYPPGGSGIGQYIARMAAALREAGHFTAIATSTVPGLPAVEELPGGAIHRLYRRDQIGSTRVTEAVLDLARQYRVDVIEGADHLGECAGILRAGPRPPVVIKLHYNNTVRVLRDAQVLYAWQHLTIGIACLRRWRRIAAERYSLARADLLLAPCERILSEARRTGSPLAPRVAVLPNPVAPIPGWQNAEAREPTLLLVGRLDIGKGIQYLPDLVRQLRDSHPGLRLEIAGGDSYARFLGSMERWFRGRLGDTRDSIRLLGQLAPANLDAAYRRAWVVIVPSRWDTFPNAVLEAMVRGKALVASPHGGMPEMLEGTPCPVADPGTPRFAEAVGALLGDRSLREKAGAAARARAVEAYAPAVLARRYVSLLESLR